MPYIDREDRDELDYDGVMPSSPGELNFVITRLVNKYINTIGPLRYRSINEAIGVIECVKLELYRRIAAPYEDKKMEEEGDVYETR